MGRSFTYCWQHSEVLRYPDGAPVVFAYGSQFARRGVCPGDEVYIVSVHRGRVHLLGKMRVRLVTHSAADFRRYSGLDPGPAAEYLLAEAYTPARLVPLPGEVARGLRFLRGKEAVGLAYRGEDLVNPQSLRGVRPLSAEGALALDGLLPALVPYQPGDAVRQGERGGRSDAAAVPPRIPARAPGKTYARVRRPKQVRFLAAMVDGVRIVVNLHKPGAYRHDNRDVAEALRTLAGAIERAATDLADQDGELAFEE